MGKRKDPEGHFSSIANEKHTNTSRDEGTENGSRWASLADRLNPHRPAYDASLKARWATMSQRERKQIIKENDDMIKARRARGEIEHPFTVVADDHCETSPEAYRHAAILLKLVAEKMGKELGDLRIYDPYFCAGAVKKHLGGLGFPNVYNECEDFYAIQGAGKVPEHDVVVTNPPYSKRDGTSREHVEFLLEFCRSNNKPFMLNMPAYVMEKPYYGECLGIDTKGADGRKIRSPLFLVPDKRYSFWTPMGLREDRSEEKKKKSHKNLYLGIRNSPFAAYWFVNLSPVVRRRELQRWWKACIEDDDGVTCQLVKQKHITLGKDNHADGAAAGDGSGHGPDKKKKKLTNRAIRRAAERAAKEAAASAAGGDLSE